MIFTQLIKRVLPDPVNIINQVIADLWQRWRTSSVITGMHIFLKYGIHILPSHSEPCRMVHVVERQWGVDKPGNANIVAKSTSAIIHAKTSIVLNARMIARPNGCKGRSTFYCLYRILWRPLQSRMVGEPYSEIIRKRCMVSFSRFRLKPLLPWPKIKVPWSTYRTYGRFADLGS